MPTAFANKHASDRNFFAVMLFFIWAAILSGFGTEMIQFSKENRLHFPLITHIHALLFVAWLLLFTVQTLLISRKQYALHMKLGMSATVLIPLMVVMGIIVAVTSEARKYGTPFSDPAFMSVMFGDMLVFGPLAAMGIYLRKQPAAHKRLLLIATLSLTDAGFGRWLSFKIVHLFANDPITYTSFADGWLSFTVAQFSCPLILILSVGVYDLFTRKKLHPVYLPSLGWWLLIGFLEMYLYYDPWWAALCKKLIGH
jgi:hypothetical protein